MSNLGGRALISQLRIGNLNSGEAGNEIILGRQLQDDGGALGNVIGGGEGEGVGGVHLVASFLVDVEGGDQEGVGLGEREPGILSPLFELGVFLHDGDGVDVVGVVGGGEG